MSTPQATSSSAKLHEALELLTEAAKEKKSELADLLASEYEDLRALLVDAGAELADREHELVDRGSERMREVASALDKKVHEDPWAALGWVSLGAVLLGYCLARKE